MTSSVTELFPELLAERKPLKKPPVVTSGLVELDSRERRLLEGGILGRDVLKAGRGWKGGMTGLSESDWCCCLVAAWNALKLVALFV